MTAYRAVVIEHFRHPRNRRSIDEATHAADGVNPLCGDRIRVQLRVAGDIITDAAFTGDACALCVASASLLTERVRGVPAAGVAALRETDIHALLGGEPPSARLKCAALPLDTMHRALSSTGS